MTALQAFKSLETPILFLLYKRPETTFRVFETIRAARPPRLYLAGDGPASASEDEPITALRSRLLDGIDWDCDVRIRMRGRHLGCRHAVSDALAWFFGHEEMGIILEDDCLPVPTFFQYCEELLIRYRDDARVGMICGRNNLGTMNTAYSYAFTTCGSIWGWASWRRVANLYNPDHPSLQSRDLYHRLLEATSDKRDAAHIARNVRRAISGELDTWDYQWVALLRLWSKQFVVPAQNLIKNIGFDSKATHTKFAGHWLVSVPARDIAFPLEHPPDVITDVELSNTLARMIIPGYLHRLLPKIPFARTLYHRAIKPLLAAFK